MTARIEPAEIVELVDAYVARAIVDAQKFDNIELLDESGIYGLHIMAAEIYAAGWAAGQRAEARRHDGERARARAV